MQIIQPPTSIINGVQFVNSQAECRIPNILINLNASGDTPIPNLPPKWRLTKCVFHDATTNLSLSLATLGLYTGTGGTGTVLVSPALLTGLTTGLNIITASLLNITSYRTESTIYARVIIPHGSSASVYCTTYYDLL